MSQRRRANSIRVRDVAVAIVVFVATPAAGAQDADSAQAAREAQAGAEAEPGAEPGATAADASSTAADASPTAAAQDAGFETHAVPLVERYCTRCHGERRARADLNLAEKRTATAVLRNRKVFERVIGMLTSREMPPEKADQPTEAERSTLVEVIRRQLESLDCSQGVDPGRPTLRRLNRIEYRNTVRDLTGIDYEPADDFPSDEIGYGFDNIGDVLSMPPLLLEKYLDAADDVVARALGAASGAARQRVFVVEPIDEHGDPDRSSIRRIIADFARRAWRRPVTDSEVDRLVDLARRAFRDGNSIDAALGLVVEAILVSPHFLFRVEIDAEPDDPDSIHPVAPFELASRLSYFLWSSMPDDELFWLAEIGELVKPDVTAGQVRRMLRDERSQAFVENFAGQWLQTRFLDGAERDSALFADYDAELRAAMRAETLLFVDAVLREDRSIFELIDSEFTFLNERLATHYGIDGVEGDAMRRVAVAGTQRGGVLTQASVLTLTSYPTRTSPVLRGKWILERILGAPPPPPPPDVPALDEEPAAILAGSLRERLEKHRQDPNCAVCHDKLDPLGFAFENFDAIGRWRDRDGQFLVDASATLPDGRRFDGPRELKRILITEQDAFARALSEQLLTYALGRGLEYHDKCAVDHIVDRARIGGYKMSDLVLATVETEAFRFRRGGMTNR